MLTGTAVIALIVYYLSNNVRQETYCTVATNKTAIGHFVIIILCEYLITFIIIIIIIIINAIN